MQQPSDDFLADTGRTSDQHPATCRRDAIDLLAQVIGCGRIADQLDMATGTQPPFLILAPEPLRLDCTLDHKQSANRFERLFYEIVRAALKRRDGRLDI